MAVPADTDRAGPLAGRGPFGGNALREWLLLLGFVLIVIAGALTVALPELSKEPEGEAGAKADAGVPRD